MNLKAPTISIRDNRDNQIGVLYDYFNDSIELFLEGKVSILTLSVLDENNYRELLVNGNSLSFTYKSEDYHMIIVKSDEDEDVITITAWSLVLELNNETKAPFSGTSLTFAQYLNAFDGEKILTLNINEVSDKKISHTFDSQQTMLERLFSLAKLFNAEIEFKTILADNGSLERLEINVYRANDSKNQGIGENKSSEVFYFGEEITTVKKSSDIMNLFTAIRPVGKDGLNLNNYTMNDVKGEDGETLFYLKNGMIYAPRARELYPSNLINKADRWTVYDWATEYESQATLCGNALAKLRDELSTPAVTWTIEGYIDANIGDTISVHDNGYKPTLLLEARINSQRISMTDPSSNETTFSNVKEVQSEISAELIAKMNDIIKEKIQYTTSIITTNGTSFKNGKGSTVLKARVLSNNADITDKVSISWYKDDSFVKSSTELTVSASDIVEKAVYRFEVIDTYGNVKNVQEVTIFNVDDGSNGLGIKNITNKYAISNSNVTPPTSWVDTPPRITEETKYLWNYDIITYTDNTTSETSKRVIGVYGDKGLDGLAGKDGLGVKTTTITYAISTSPTDTPSSGWTNQVPTLEKGKYLWTKTQWTYTDNTVENGYTVSYIAKDGNDGNDGVAGKDGVGISDTLIQYTGSTNGTTKPTTGWSTSIPAVAEGNYLWTKTTWTYTDGTNETGYSVSKMGAKGADGKDGIAGKDGVGLKETVIRYASSTSGTTAPTTGWQSSVPIVTPGNFLWTRTVWTYTDNSSEIGYSVARIGADGNDGEDGIAGKDGVGLKSTTVTYAGSANGVTAPTNGWTLSIPSVADGNFLWTKTTWTYTDNTSEIGYSVARMGTKGSDGIAGKDGIGIKSTSIIYAGSTNGTVAPTTGWSTSIPVVPAGNYLWTKTTWAYTDGTSESGFTVSRIGKDGNTGKDGIAGKDGVGLKETSIQYAGSTSGTTPPTTGWTAQVPTVASGSYLWTKTTWSYTDDTNETGYSVSKMGEPGAKGDSATSYWVTPSVNAIQISATKVLNPTTITFTGYSKTGTANAGLYAGRFNILTSVDGIVYSSKYSSSANQSAYTYTVPADIKFIKARMYQAGGFTALVDEVTIPIIESAEGLEIGGRNYITDTARVRSINGNGGTNQTQASTSFYFSLPLKDFAKVGDTFTFSTTAEISGSGFAGSFFPQTAFNAWVSLTPVINITKAETINIIRTLTITQEMLNVPITVIRIRCDNVPSTVKIDFSKVMLSKGNKALDWVPALEDAKLYTAWSNDPNGADMVRTYPNENLLVKKTLTSGSSAIGAVVPLHPLTSTASSSSNRNITIDNRTDGGIEITTATASDPFFRPISGISGADIAPVGTEMSLSFRYDIPSGNYLRVRIINFGSSPDGGNTFYEGKGTAQLRMTIGTSTVHYLSFDPVSSKDSTYTVGDKVILYDVKFSKGTSLPYTPSPIDDPVKAEMAYIGYSPKDSNDPADYVWSENPKAKGTFQRWSNVLGGSELSFATVLPTLNIVENGDFLDTVDGTAALNPGIYPNRWGGYNGGISDPTKNWHAHVDQTTFGYNVVEYNESNGVRNWKGITQNIGTTSDAFAYLQDVKQDIFISLDIYTTMTGANNKVFGGFYYTSKSLGTIAFHAGQFNITPTTPNKWQRLSAMAPLNRDDVDWTKSLSFYIYGYGFSNNAIIYIKDVNISEGTSEMFLQSPFEAGNSRFETVPKYIGFGIKDSNNPSDFQWTTNPDYTQALTDSGLEDKVDNDSYENDKSDIWEEISNRTTEEEAAAIREMAESIKNSYEAFVSSGGQYQLDLEALEARSALLVQNLGDQLATYNFLKTYIKLGEEGLVIGADGSSMKMLLSKDKLSFTDGGQVVAYFSNQSFYINRGAIVDSLQVGQHKMVRLNSDHTVFQWVKV